MDSLVTYLVAAMTAWVPLQGAAASRRTKRMARYESIARDVAAVAFDEAEEPLFPGPDGRAQTALFMLSIASFESAYRKRRRRRHGRGDHGHSYCLMQIRVGDGTTREGWTGRQLVDRSHALLPRALHILHGIVQRLPPSARSRTA